MKRQAIVDLESESLKDRNNERIQQQENLTDKAREIHPSHGNDETVDAQSPPFDSTLERQEQQRKPEVEIKQQRNPAVEPEQQSNPEVEMTETEPVSEEEADWIEPVEPEPSLFGMVGLPCQPLQALQTSRPSFIPTAAIGVVPPKSNKSSRNILKWLDDWCDDCSPEQEEEVSRWSVPQHGMWKKPIHMTITSTKGLMASANTNIESVSNVHTERRVCKTRLVPRKTMLSDLDGSYDLSDDQFDALLQDMQNPSMKEEDYLTTEEFGLRVKALKRRTDHDSAAWLLRKHCRRHQYRVFSKHNAATLDGHDHDFAVLWNEPELGDDMLSAIDAMPIETDNIRTVPTLSCMFCSLSSESLLASTVYPSELRIVYGIEEPQQDYDNLLVGGDFDDDMLSDDESDDEMDEEDWRILQSSTLAGLWEVDDEDFQEYDSLDTDDEYLETDDDYYDDDYGDYYLEADEDKLDRGLSTDRASETQDHDKETATTREVNDDNLHDSRIDTKRPPPPPPPLTSSRKPAFVTSHR